MFLSLGKWLLLLLVIAGVYWVIQFSSLQDFLAPEKLSIFLQELGVAGPFALMGLMTLAVVVSPIPSLPLDLAAGAAYGPLWGAVYVLIGAEFGDPKARIIQLARRQKKPYVGASEPCTGVLTTARPAWAGGTSHAGMRGYNWKWRCSAFPAGGAAR